MNDCLEKVPPLQKKLWDVWVRSSLHPVILCADIEKAFLQICIRDSQRDCPIFIWAEASNIDKIEIYRFAMLMFGLTQSPFILEEILDLHFNNCAQEVWEVSEKVRDNMYLDDMVTGGESINEVTKWKSDSISLFRQEVFRLHKWHSKETLSETKYYCNTTKLNFAKRQWGTKANETKIIEMLWVKQSDSFITENSDFSKRLTRKNILQHTFNKWFIRKYFCLFINWKSDLPR